MSQNEIGRNYVEAYKYAFSRKGERIENFKSTFILMFIIHCLLCYTFYMHLYLYCARDISIKYSFAEDWTGPINYYRNLPFSKLNIDNGEQIDNKMLLIIGNMDPLVTIENIIQSSEHVEVSRVKVISNAQHFPHQEKPDAVNKAIIKFLIGEFYFSLVFVYLLLYNFLLIKIIFL